MICELKSFLLILASQGNQTNDFDRSESFDPISLLSESMTPLQVEELPQPCLLNANELSHVSSINEIGIYTNPDTALMILEPIIDFQSKLKRALEAGFPQSINYVNSTNFGTEDRRAQATHSVGALPSLSSCELPKQDFTITPSTTSIIQIESSHNRIIYGTMKHPLFDPVSFNLAFSELSFLAEGVKAAMQIHTNCQLIPYYNSVGAIFEEGNSVTMFWQRGQSSKDIISNSSATVLILQDILAVAESATRTLNAQISYKINLTLLDSMLKINKTSLFDESAWDSFVSSMTTIAMFFVHAIEKYSQQTSSKSISDLIEFSDE